MPQYRYAYDDQNHIQDVAELTPDHSRLGESYHCIGCGGLLIAKTKGEYKEKHFAHKVRVECSEETYLHRLAKDTFYDVYVKCLAEKEPFTIGLTHRRVCVRFKRLFGTQCDIGERHKTYDLTQYYTGIMLEQRDDQFIPDVMLYSHSDPSKKIYIEVAVTHFLSEEKGASGHRIIEIPLTNEADISIIRSRHIPDTVARFVNVDRGHVSIPDADCVCAKEQFYCFFIYKSGKSILEKGTPESLMALCRKQGENVMYTDLVDTRQWPEQPQPSDLFKRCMHKAHAQGFPVRNCMLCKYSGRNWNMLLNNKAIFCKAKKIACTSNEAASCSLFRLRPDHAHDRWSF